MKYDFIIIGQGLAGSAVAVQLLKRNYRVLVFDEPGANNSSRIAAGLFNPVTGKKKVKTWMADTLFPYLHHYYSDIESLTGKHFFYSMPLYRPFLSIEEQNEWMAKSADPLFSNYIHSVNVKPVQPQLKDPYGGLLLKQSGFINTTEYLDAVRILISRSSTLLHEAFQPEHLVFEDDFVRYGNYTATKIIICSGARQSDWFNWLPIQPLKGETLTIKSECNLDFIINRGVYMVPLQEPGVWRVGATYQFQDKTEMITTQAQNELIEKIEMLVEFPFSVETQEWGMRPTTPDRRPILGEHPEFNKLIIFNGLGTKGVSLAPYFSEMLVHWLEKKGTLNKEVDIERYKSLYSGSAT